MSFLMTKTKAVNKTPQTIHVEAETYSIPKPSPYASAKNPAISGAVDEPAVSKTRSRESAELRASGSTKSVMDAETFGPAMGITKQVRLPRTMKPNTSSRGHVIVR